MTRVSRGPAVETPGRRWKGQEPEDRRAQRRAQLVEAATDLLGVDGASAVTMRGVTRRAGLSERYFYESFPHREALLVTVLEEVVDGAREVVARALERGDEPRAVVAAFTDHVTADPRRGRILFIESLAAPALARRGHELATQFTALVAAYLGDPDEPGHPGDEVVPVAVFGALAHLYARWLAGGLALDRDTFVDRSTDIVVRLTGTVGSAGSVPPA